MHTQCIPLPSLLGENLELSCFVRPQVKLDHRLSSSTVPMDSLTNTWKNLFVLFSSAILYPDHYIVNITGKNALLLKVEVLTETWMAAHLLHKGVLGGRVGVGWMPKSTLHNLLLLDSLKEASTTLFCYIGNKIPVVGLS